MRNILFIFIFFVLSILQFHCASSYYTDVKNWKYFRIDARTSDNEVFLKLQEELNIYPLYESYIIYVDLRSKKPEDRYLLIGDIGSPNSIKKQWLDLKEETRRGIMNWDGSNKTNLED